MIEFSGGKPGNGGSERLAYEVQSGWKFGGIVPRHCLGPEGAKLDGVAAESREAV